MKVKILSVLLLAVVITVSAQDNKFSKGDLGIRYGVSFGNGIQQQLTFSGMVGKQLEVGSSIAFSFRRTSSASYDSSLVLGAAGYVPGERGQETRSGNYFVSVSPFVAYHFPVKSNLDIYTGGYLGIGLSNTIANHSITTVTAQNINRERDVSTTQPVTFSVRPGIMLGCQYFFYKRLALGVEGQLGAAFSVAKGKSHDKVVITNTGSDNLEPSSSSEATSRSSYNDFSLATQGTIGVNLTFYFSQKAKSTNTPKSM